MGSLMVSPELFRVALKIAGDYNLPMTIPGNLIRFMAPDLLSEIDPDIIMVDNYVSMYPEIAGDNWDSLYRDFITNLKPGLNEMIFHLSYDNDEMKAIASGHADFGSAWRQKDLDFVLSDDFKELLKQNNVYPVTWRQIRDLNRQDSINK